MSFATLKQDIANAVKLLELCEDYQDICTSVDETELIEAAKDHVEWAYSSGIITPVILSQFTESILNGNNVYNAGSHTLSNPKGDVFITGNANVTINSTGFNRLRIVLVSDLATLTINASNCAYIKILRVKCNGSIVATLNNNAAIAAEIQGNGIVDITANADTSFHASLREGTILNYHGAGNSNAVIKAYHSSQVTIFSGSNVNVKNYDSSTRNEYNPAA